MGSICAQEVMKAASGKFSPITQWLYFDAFECLHSQDSNDIFPQEFVNQPNSRYAGQIAVFGTDFQEKLSNLNYFVVIIFLPIVFNGHSVFL